ncbi:MAG TPA: hypothetical protein VKU86_10440, partial [Acidimicrobiales bacterium]|nr:hypothetical protein [Acidimicrobiales bacterium]
CVQRLAADVASVDQRALTGILHTYDTVASVTGAEAWEVEARAAAQFHGGGVNPAEIEQRRRSIVERGREQV